MFKSTFVLLYYIKNIPCLICNLQIQLHTKNIIYKFSLLLKKHN